MSNVKQFLLLVAFVFLCCITGMEAQTTTTGAVNGVITDQSGAVIPSATVVLTKDSTGAVQTAKSSSSGTYRFDLLEPGSYTVTVNQPGFEKLKSTLNVDNSQVTAANLRLTIGSDQQTIEVSTVGALINSDNGNVATTVSQVQVEEVPNSGNNLLYETKITPGFNNGGSAYGVVGNTSYQIDGQNYNDPYNNANNSGASNLTLGLDDVQEATITGNGYSGQFGGLVGASVSFVSKSGSNRIHGDLNWYWTGSSLVANEFVHKEGGPGAIIPRTFENANQWAGQISGPVTVPHLWSGKDKLFFLADAEGLRAILPASPTTVQLPSANLQAYTLSRLNAQGLSASVPYYNTMFALYNKAAASHSVINGNQNISNSTTPTATNPIAFPHATTTGCSTTANALSIADLQGLGFTVTPDGKANNGTPLYIADGAPAGACSTYYQSTATTVANEALEIFRVDFNASAKDKMFIRYEHDNGFQPTYTDPINSNFNAISIQPSHNGQFNETHLFGAKATNNIVIAGLWYGAIFGPANQAATIATFPAQLNFSDGSLGPTGGTYALGGEDASFPTGRNITTVQFQDDFAINEGAHTFKVGAKAYYIKENDHYFTAGTIPSETVATLGAFINGGYDPAFTTGSGSTLNYTYATTFAQTFPVKQNHPVGIDQWAVYGEDDWKATHALSMSFALRLEHQGNIKCLDNCLTELASPFPSLTHSSTIPYNQAYSFNQKDVLPGLQELEWEPRFGFAYNPSFMHESMVIRGGYGIFYDGLAASVLEGVAKNPPAKDSFSVSQDHLSPNEASNLWSDTVAYNNAYLAGITTGATVASLKASLPSLAEQNSFTPPSVYAAQNNFKMYNVQKWNLEIQKQFGSKTVLSVNYLGNHGEHKPYTNAGLNAYTYPTAAATIAGLPTGTAPINGYSTGYTPVDPRFGLVYYFVSGGSNNYNGVITTVTRKLGTGSLITAGYTYGKILDNGANGFSTSTSTGTTDIGAPPDPYHPNINYGPAATDIRHNFVVDYVYKLPFGHGGKYFADANPFVDTLIGGWQVSGAAYAYSGLPFTVIDTATTGLISSYKTGAYGGSLLATYNGGGEATCGYGLQACLNKSQFSAATSVDSNQSRNIFRGPMYVSTDFAATKEVPLHWEGGRFSVSAQAFNVLNHLNFAKPTGSWSNGSFAKITAPVNPSGVFSGIGGDDSPRVVQLKAKLVF